MSEYKHRVVVIKHNDSLYEKIIKTLSVGKAVMSVYGTFLITRHIYRSTKDDRDWLRVRIEKFIYGDAEGKVKEVKGE